MWIYDIIVLIIGRKNIKNNVELEVMMSEDKLYRIKTKDGAHINKKIKEDGSISAIQFDEENGLQGPVDLVEVDESEYTREVYIESERCECSFGQAIIEDAVVPVVAEVTTILLERAVDAGINAFGNLMANKVIPTMKNKKEEFKEKAREQKKQRKEKSNLNECVTTEKINSDLQLQEKIENNTVIHTTEEVEQILNNMKFASLYIAAGIRELSNTAIEDDELDSKRKEEIQVKLNELSAGNVMNTIDFMLEDKNREMLDKATIQIFEAFRNRDFIVDGETVPISRYLQDVVDD